MAKVDVDVNPNFVKAKQMNRDGEFIWKKKARRLCRTNLVFAKNNQLFAHDVVFGWELEIGEKTQKYKNFKLKNDNNIEWEMTCTK